MEDETDRPSIADRFNRSHSARRRSATLERLWREAYGDDYPVEICPSAFYSLSTLRRMITALQVAPNSTVADLGCGNGGASLWFARELDVQLIGIDLSAAGVAAAAEHANEIGLGHRTSFREGNMTDTGLPGASCDAAISLDVLVFVPDKPAAMAEVARILKPGGRFALTTWEQSGFSQRLNAMQCDDHQALLNAAGFEVEIYEEPRNWRHHQRAVLESIVGAENELAGEMEPVTLKRFIAMARGSLDDLEVRRYVMLVARKRP